MTTKQPKPTDTESVVRFLAGLPLETRRALLRMGCVIPAAAKGGDPAALKWGYRCKHCNRVALYFVGESFQDHAGNEVAQPPVTLPIEQIPWTQDGTAMPNRRCPNCQSCGGAVHLEGERLSGKLIVEVAAWIKSRDEALAKLEATRRERARKLDMVEQPPIPEKFIIKQLKPSEYLSQDAKDDITMMDRAGMTANIERV